MAMFGNCGLIRVFDALALEENLLSAMKLAGGPVGAVVKSDAYGFGLSRALPVFLKHGVRDYFVQSLAEALPLRHALDSGNIYVLAGVEDGQEAAFAKGGLIPACVSLGQLSRYGAHAAKLKRKLEAAVHFDTGMNRAGLSASEAGELARDWNKLAGNLDIVLYMSHLSSAYAPRRPSNAAQLAGFRAILSKLPVRPASLAASGGLFCLPQQYRFGLPRVGAALYGLVRGTRPAMALYAKILQVRGVEKGAGIGYFGNYTAPRGMKLAVLDVGFADGYVRGLSHANGWRDRVRGWLHSGAGFARSYAVIGGYRCPLVGLVSMNNITIDATDVPEGVLERARWAEILGPNAKLADFREASGYIPEDMVVSLMRPNPNALDMERVRFDRLGIL